MGRGAPSGKVTLSCFRGRGTGAGRLRIPLLGFSITETGAAHGCTTRTEPPGGRGEESPSERRGRGGAVNQNKATDESKGDFLGCFVSNRNKAMEFPSGFRNMNRGPCLHVRQTRRANDHWSLRVSH